MEGDNKTLQEGVVLPEKYYLDYFNAILNYIREKYTHLLLKKEAQFLDDFQNLPEDARCVYIRMIMRRGEFFRFNDLNYKEIGDLRQNLSHLAKTGFVGMIDVNNTIDPYVLLPFLKKSELQVIAKRVGESPAKSAKKEVYVTLLKQVTVGELQRHIATEFDLYQQKKTATAEMMFFLYFGTLHRDISEFVVRDLGFRTFVAQREDRLTAYFKTREEVDEKWQVSKLRIAFFERMEEDPTVVFPWLKDALEALELKTAAALNVLERLKVQAARWFEKVKQPALALQLYEGLQQPPANERRIRILEKMGQTAEALAQSKALQQNTVHPEEFFFARDFIQRLETGKRSLKSTTKRLKAAQSISISPSFKQQVEMGALDYYAQQGYHGIFMENVCWRAFFGLLFWEVIFDDAQDAFHHPFQSVPSDWRTDLFYEKRKTAIHDLLGKMLEGTWLEQQMERIFKEKYGLNNPLVNWYEALHEHLAILLKYITKQQLQAVLLKMAKNLQSNTKGFPDLFVYNANTYQFIEIKSPNDSLSAQQLYWIEFFEETGIMAKVVKVKYHT